MNIQLTDNLRVKSTHGNIKDFRVIAVSNNHISNLLENNEILSPKEIIFTQDEYSANIVLCENGTFQMKDTKGFNDFGLSYMFVAQRLSCFNIFKNVQ